ncbi:gliding motility-associated C-terminal domain-containing protein [Chryseobacterium sp. MFBS3-17]|uniref:T9SS type B sorting domain-containing protein n=1 Tax=Chryseobacterium sp. MFBS3-17 TaxID=2886689 RepID=UPI001D0E32E2|nr:gliding motility-associated C-terminal domain-containing protein [Chryseobacterium sp. MFBS3-17]MCC2589668.1 gliding motility-associated C-terminal domain-containing protein [Chryseobacterium sp. MFBS3-17]
MIKFVRNELNAVKKYLPFILFLFMFANVYSQLDREHWFAPMIDRSGNPFPFQKVYLSTNRTTPFPVSIYNNNVLIGTVTISKGNPQKFDIPRQYIITTLQNDLFTPITKGLNVKAEFPFYANLRFSVYNHAEIVTSKGTASAGTTFYTAMAPLTVENPILNFMTGILATEDNTTVTVSGYPATVQFSNGTTGATNPVMTFTLNKGQSYIIEGKGDVAANGDSFIGSKIVASKPVNVTNGNFNGQYAGLHPLSSDILMDQSIPTNHLGNTFALVKGFGTVGNNMEGALVVAIQNNTEVYLNNETVPAAVLNEGEHYVVPDNKYIPQGTSHHNLYISTSQNAYVYQLLSGIDSGGNSVATGGFNFIPALNCYLPKQIDELGLIDENEVYSNANPTGILNIPTKLNLITEVGAIVQINGVAPPAGAGPFPMTGTTNWVTYGIPNVTGNVTVTSSKAITAGINAGTDAVGYGGFFAGFPTQPVILTSGTTCIPGIILTVDPIIYDSYQWFLNGTLIPGATSASITPTEPGYYTASVTMGSCAPLVTSQFKVEKCMVNTSVTYNICVSQNITPAFTSVSVPQNIALSSIQITTPPALGTVTINAATGEIVYTTTNPGVSGTDTFTYTFCGDHPDFPECETVTVTINIAQIPVNNVTLNACNVNGQGTYDLTSAAVTTQTPVTITYYPTLNDAQTENPAALIGNTGAYTTAPTTVYAVVASPEGCKSIAQIILGFFPLAVVSDFSQTFCDDNVDGIIEINLNNISTQVLQNAAYFGVQYYPTLADATAGNANTLPVNWTFTANTTIYIRVNSPDGCAPVIKALNFIFGTAIPLLTTTSVQTVCDEDFDGIADVNLMNYLQFYTNDPQVTATFHHSLANAQNNTGALTNPVNVDQTGTYFIRFEKPGICPSVAEIIINIKTPKESDTLVDQVICQNRTTVLDAGAGFEAYLWSTGETTQAITVGIGNYWVDLTFNGCMYRQEVSVTAAELPVITAIDIKDNTVTITVTGGTPPYQYSLDGITWQTSNVFYNVGRGTYTIYVKDDLDCSIVTKQFSIINLINAITPNGDGVNDLISYAELLTKEDPVFRIFDRYGAEVFTGTPANRFTWDGMVSPTRHVPTATYWYILQWREFGTDTVYSYTSWLLVKNRMGNIFED